MAFETALSLLALSESLTRRQYSNLSGIAQLIAIFSSVTTRVTRIAPIRLHNYHTPSGHVYCLVMCRRVWVSVIMIGFLHRTSYQIGIELSHPLISRKLVDHYENSNLFIERGLAGN